MAFTLLYVTSYSPDIPQFTTVFNHSSFPSSFTHLSIDTVSGMKVIQQQQEITG
jgi:hypothetical protein